MLLNWREYPSVSIYYVHKGLVVWTTHAMAGQASEDEEIKALVAQDSSVPEKVHTVHVNQMFLTRLSCYQ